MEKDRNLIQSAVLGRVQAEFAEVPFVHELHGISVEAGAS